MVSSFDGLSFVGGGELIQVGHWRCRDANNGLRGHLQRIVSILQELLSSENPAQGGHAKLFTHCTEDARSRGRNFA